MAKLQCPKCGASVPSSQGWATSALTTLMQAPAVPHLAPQVRCHECQHLFSQLDGSQRNGWLSLWSAVLLIAVLLTTALWLPG